MTGYSKNMVSMSNPMDQLTDELLVEILSRVPYKSLCRFKCVSRRWRDIISHPGHRKVLPQYHLDVLAGFIHCSYDRNVLRDGYYFSSVSVGGHPTIDPALTFLSNCARFDILDSCNGLLLCRCFRTIDSVSFNYVVCNPATEKVVLLPGWFDEKFTARLGFEPAVSSHFHVFQFLEDPNDHMDPSVIGVDIYSSKTGVWIHKDSRWDADITIPSRMKSVFCSGVLCLIAFEFKVVTVDVEGNTWRMIPVPEDDASPYITCDSGFIDLSQGCLHFANTDYDGPKLSIWVLEDCSTENWILKHTVRCINLFGIKNVEYITDYTIVAIHSERNTIFIVYGDDKVLMSYEMDSGKVCYIHGIEPPASNHYLPYVPLYSESLADGQ